MQRPEDRRVGVKIHDGEKRLQRHRSSVAEVATGRPKNRDRQTWAEGLVVICVTTSHNTVRPTLRGCSWVPRSSF